jgi:hypothetical protein
LAKQTIGIGLQLLTKETNVNEMNARKQRWLDFYEMDGMTRFMLIANYEKCACRQPMLWYEKKNERIAWAYAMWQAAMEEAANVPDDYVPSLSMMTGTEIFAEAMGCKVHYPEVNNPFAIASVHSAADAMEFLDDWFTRYGTAYVAHFPDYYMEGDITLSEDEIGIISPKMFSEFALPSLVEMSRHFEGIGIHCCADSERQWDHMKRIPNLKLLNLFRPPESSRESLRVFVGIQRFGPLTAVTVWTSFHGQASGRMGATAC